jgi:hypothetical protein
MQSEQSRQTRIALGAIVLLLALISIVILTQLGMGAASRTTEVKGEAFLKLIRGVEPLSGCRVVMLGEEDLTAYEALWRRDVRAVTDGIARLEEARKNRDATQLLVGARKNTELAKSAELAAAQRKRRASEQNVKAAEETLGKTREFLAEFERVKHSEWLIVEPANNRTLRLNWHDGGLSLERLRNLVRQAEASLNIAKEDARRDGLAANSASSAEQKAKRNRAEAEERLRMDERRVDLAAAALRDALDFSASRQYLAQQPSAAVADQRGAFVLRLKPGKYHAIAFWHDQLEMRLFAWQEPFTVRSGESTWVVLNQGNSVLPEATYLKALQLLGDQELKLWLDSLQTFP